MKHSFYCEFHKKVELVKEVGCKQVQHGYMCDNGFEEYAYQKYFTNLKKKKITA